MQCPDDQSYGINLNIPHLQMWNLGRKAFTPTFEQKLTAPKNFKKGAKDEKKGQNKSEIGDKGLKMANKLEF